MNADGRARFDAALTLTPDDRPLFMTFGRWFVTIGRWFLAIRLEAEGLEVRSRGSSAARAPESSAPIIVDPEGVILAAISNQQPGIG